MKKFMLFVGGLIALLILLSMLGPIVLLGVSVWLLYVAFKQIVKSDSTLGKIGWIIVGLIVLSIALSNIYAVIGVAAAFALYLIFKNWNSNKNETHKQTVVDEDPFTNFEKQWAELELNK